jgi:hypothetical protein
MKSKRIISLLIVLMVAICGAVYYFVHEEQLFEDGPLAPNVSEPRVYFHTGLAGGRPTIEPDAFPSVTLNEIPSSDEKSLPWEAFEERVQSVSLGTNSGHTYTLFFKESLGMSSQSPWPVSDNYVLGERAEESSQFWITNTTVAQKNEYQEVVRTYKNIESGKEYTVPLVRFWFIGNTVSPEQAVTALITSPNPAITKTGACDVVTYDPYMQEDRVQDTQTPRAFDTTYQIQFLVEKLGADLLQQISNKSLSGICGTYGPYQSEWRGFSAGTFVADGGVLIYIDPSTSTISEYNLIRVAKTKN